MNREEKFLGIINRTLKNSSFLGDDCAYLKDFNLVVSTDTLVEDVHFKLNTISPFELGKKALLVNISDILASGAKPEYLTVSLSGNFDENFTEEFYKGADEICEKFGVDVIGGDLTGGDKISVTVTVLGDTRGRNISSRKNAKAGYVVLLAGEHGSSATGLSILLGQADGRKTEGTERSAQACGKTGDKKEGQAGCFCGAERENEREYFIKSHIEPVLQRDFSEIISKNCTMPYAMADTSDGLYDALKKISESSGAGFSIEFDKIPKKINDFNRVLFGGEDYGLLACVSASDFEIIKDDIIKTGCAVIGHVREDKAILFDGAEIIEDLRYEHFM